MQSLYRTLFAIAVTSLGVAAVGISHAHAYNTPTYLFSAGILNKGGQELILNGGSTIIQANDAGAFGNDGSFRETPNYFVGYDGNFNYRDFFTFSLSGVTGPITSASLSIYNPYQSFYGYSTVFTVHNATSLIPAFTVLNTTEGPIYPNSFATYEALALGTIFGTTNITSSVNGSVYNGSYYDGTDVIVNLNPSAIAALNQLEGQSFAVSGTLPFSALPLPATLPMFVCALLGMFAAVRLSSKRTVI